MARRAKRSRQPAPDPTPAASAVASYSAVRRDLAWLTAGVIVAFATAVPGDFVWLDHAEIERANYRVVDANDFRRVWHETIEQYQAHRTGVVVKQGGYWRPVYALAISLDWALWNGRAWLYHVENILWHLAVVLLLYALGNQVFGATETGRRAVFWGTLLFAVHPLGVHSVTWISGRKDTMCAAFGVAALVAFGRALGHAQQPERRRTLPWLLLSGACLVLSIGSKELGFVVPLVATVLFVPWYDSPNTRRDWRTWIVGSGALWACAMVLAWYRVAIVGARGLDAPYPADSLLANVAMSCNVWWHYVRQLLLPFDVRLSDAWPVVQTLGPADLLSIVAMAAAAAGTLHGLYRQQLWAVGVVWFVVWMLPASGLLPLRHFRAERYLYPASWGLLMAALLLLLPLAEKLFASHARRVTPIMLAVAAGLFALTTVRENTRWWSDAALFEHSVAQDPHYAEGHIELAALALERGDNAGSAARSREALRALADPSYAAYGVPFYAHHIYGTSLVRLGQAAEAAEQFQAMIRQSPESSGGYSGLAMAEAMQGNMAAAKTKFLRALELEPNDSSTRNNLSLVLVELGEFAEVVPHVERLIREQPDDASHRARLAWCQWKLGQRDQALRTLNLARTQAPEDATVRQVEQMIRSEQSARSEGP